MPVANTHAGNARRTVRLREMVDIIRAGEVQFTVKTVHEKMPDLGETCVKNYLRLLVGFNVLAKRLVKTDRQHPTTYFSVCASPEFVADILKQLTYDTSRPMPKPPGTKPQAERLVSDPSRHFHLAADDEHVTVRIPHKKHIPASDPLLAAFFGQVVA